MSEQGTRLNIKKAILRHWRSEFARHLRTLGVEANATERAVRGQQRKGKKDAIYRAASRGNSIFFRKQVEHVASDLSKGGLRDDEGSSTLIRTRQDVERGWLTAARLLAEMGEQRLASEVRQFVSGFPAVQTEREIIAEQLRQRLGKSRIQDSPVR